MARGYTKEIIRGFSEAWHCLVGTPARRAAFLKKLSAIRGQPRRWIYLATEKYARILRSSVAPSALQSKLTREALIKRLCSRGSVSAAVIQSEIKALKQLDLPYFVRETAESMPADKSAVPSELIQAIRNTLLPAKVQKRKG